jgi:hypothetical protein
MRPLTKNEKILLPVLALVVFGGINFFGYKWLAQRQGALALQEPVLRAQQTASEAELEQAPLWQERRQWLEAHEPALGDEGDTKAQVLATLLKGARDHHLDILEQTINDTTHGPGGARVNVAVRVKGSMEGLARWLAELQQPQDFYAVTLFSLKADEDQKSMVCALEIARFFKEGS